MKTEGKENEYRNINRFLFFSLFLISFQISSIKTINRSYIVIIIWKSILSLETTLVLCVFEADLPSYFPYTVLDSSPDSPIVFYAGAIAYGNSSVVIPSPVSMPPG